MFKKNYSLKSVNTFGINVKSKQFSSFKSKKDLKNILSSAQSPLLILGGGSNILLTQDFEGTVLKNEIEGIEIVKETEEHSWVRVGGGITWHDFVMWSIDQELSGIENLSLIPGSTGAAPMQNIGAYGVEIESVFSELEAIEIENLETKIFDKKACAFGYRYSVFKGSLKGKYIIISVTFKLNKKHTFKTSYGAINQELKKMQKEASLRSISQAVINIRQSKLPDPKEIGNSGSFFKNPVIETSLFKELQKKYPNIVGYTVSESQTKVAAGWMIDQAGWKGFKKGDAGVHKNQALVLVNYDQASGKEILQLAKEIQKSIQSTFGIALEMEVNII